MSVCVRALIHVTIPLRVFTQKAYLEAHLKTQQSVVFVQLSRKVDHVR